jgi:hypothetical protein
LNGKGLVAFYFSFLYDKNDKVTKDIQIKAFGLSLPVSSVALRSTPMG